MEYKFRGEKPLGITVSNKKKKSPIDAHWHPHYRRDPMIINVWDWLTSISFAMGMTMSIYEKLRKIRSLIEFLFSRLEKV